MSGTKIGIFLPGDCGHTHNATGNWNQTFQVQPIVRSLNGKWCNLWLAGHITRTQSLPRASRPKRWNCPVVACRVI
jgi:hypothetical protein